MLMFRFGSFVLLVMIWAFVMILHACVPIMHAYVVADFGFSSHILFVLFESRIGSQYVCFPIFLILVLICMIRLVLDFYFDENI